MPSRPEIADVVHRRSDVEKILTLHPETASRCLLHISKAEIASVKFGIAQARRTWAQQAEIYGLGRNERGEVVDRKKVRTWARPGLSFHQYGLAYDVVLLYPKKNSAGFYEVEWSPDADLDADGVRDYLEIGLCGEAVGMAWGGRWPRGKTDQPHFEYAPGLEVKVAVARFPDGIVPDDYFGAEV